ncbi:SCO family protein [Photobacterium leiognathi]|uniref:SCO family protein n=1 Tax=Photobacterium leiognathi TaxID=553611 RepID=UPI000D16B803|nr:SCO family protein [Photobacterium leiognathi]PSW43227.1 SCO family protein [Photobacterium leiognathi subsp. mandapamensis]
MLRYWSIFLIFSIVFSFGIYTYIFEKTEAKNPQIIIQKKPILFGSKNKPVNIFDISDKRIRILYFGFTRCPEICPTSLAMLAGALNKINNKQQAKIRPIFISLDPERDSADHTAQYAHYFNPMIEGLAAPLDVITPLAKKYGVIFRKVKLENSALKYTVDHNSYFYFVKPDGTLITKVPHTLTPRPIIEAIEKLTTT